MLEPSLSQGLINQRVGNSRFVIGEYVTGGAFGLLHFGYDSKNGQKVAIKMEKQGSERPQLHLEYGFYKNLTTLKFLPKIFYFGPCHDWNALVMELLGPSLFKINQTCGGRFGITTTTKLLLQLLDIFEFVHDHGIIYRDIKPDNFLIGQPNTARWSTVHIIDMGFCKRYIDEKNRHIEFRGGKCITGTTRYVSCNNHRFVELSRRDDLEAVLYMMIFLHKGELPWQGVQAETAVERCNQIGKIKMTIPATELCSDMPPEYAFLLDSIKALEFKERPKYSYFKCQLQSVLSKLGTRLDDDNYDWDKEQNHISEQT